MEGGSRVGSSIPNRRARLTGETEGTGRAAGGPGCGPASAPLAAGGGAQVAHTPPHLAPRGLRR